MTSPHPSVQIFGWSPSRSAILVRACAAIVLIGSGLEFLNIAGQVKGLGPALLTGAWGLLLLFTGGHLLFVLVVLMPCHARGWVLMVSVHLDRMCIHESPLVDLFQKSVIVPFEAVVRVWREHLGRKGECLRIVHGPEFKTETIAEVRPADLEAILSTLAKRCPSAIVQIPLVPSSPGSFDGV